MKFTTTAKPVVAAAPKKVEKLPTLAELQASFLRLEALTGKLQASEELMRNAELALKALSAPNAGAETIRVLNIDKGLEELMGVCEKEITVKAAIEALNGQAIKDAWQAVVDWFKKIAVAIRDFIGKFFQTTGHMGRTVLANMDKVNWDVTMNIPDYKVLSNNCALALRLGAIANAWLMKLMGVKEIPSDMDETKFIDLNQPFKDRIKAVVESSNGAVIYDEDTGNVTIEMANARKDQTLKEAGYTADNIKQLINSPQLPFPRFMINYSDNFWKYCQVIQNLKWDISEGAAGAIGGEQAAKIVRQIKAYVNCCYSVMRACLGDIRECSALTAKVYGTLPEDLKKRV